MTPDELRQLITGSGIIAKARGGKKEILPGEMPTTLFAYASVVAINDIPAGATLNESNIWVKRPGTGEIRAESYHALLGRKARVAIHRNEQIRWAQII
jgi:N-acetylneuraminate synthase